LSKTSPIARRIADLPWREIETSLAEMGYALTRPLLRPDECAQLRGWFEEDARFRSRVVMERHNFGQGEYAYFAEPLPRIVSALRSGLYRRVAPLANRWAKALRSKERFPKTLSEYRALCRAAGQTKPTPLLLHYSSEGYNRLHRDRYGELQFPIQAMVMLSRAGVDFEGGEFLLVENRPRQQSLGHALAPTQGELVLFAGGERPAAGKRGVMRASLRHGTNRISAGERYSLGIIFHDAA
jgi:hypothetical protein